MLDTHFKTCVIITLAQQSLRIGALQALVANLQVKENPGLSWDEAFEQQKQQNLDLWARAHRDIITEMALRFGVCVDLDGQSGEALGSEFDVWLKKHDIGGPSAIGGAHA